MELRWPLCTGWTLGWGRMLPMPVSIPSCGCCPVVVDRCLMLSHTQCNRSPAWSEQWPGTASEVCFDLLPTSDEQPLGWGWEHPCTVFSTLMCFLSEMCESHHSPRNFVDSSAGRSVFPTLTMGDLWVRDRGAVKCTTLHLWAANLKPFLTWYELTCEWESKCREWQKMINQWNVYFHAICNSINCGIPYPLLAWRCTK